jgi:hypothetical protein
MQREKAFLFKRLEAVRMEWPAVSLGPLLIALILERNSHHVSRKCPQALRELTKSQKNDIEMQVAKPRCEVEEIGFKRRRLLEPSLLVVGSHGGDKTDRSRMSAVLIVSSALKDHLLTQLEDSRCRDMKSNGLESIVPSKKHCIRLCSTVEKPGGVPRMMEKQSMRGSRKPSTGTRK